MTSSNNIHDIAFHQGISDFVRGKNRPPRYWRGTEEESVWRKGFNFARRWAQ